MIPFRPDPTVPLVTYEAGDLTADHAVAIFRAWSERLPGFVWVHATADRITGLVLVSRLDHSGLHFNKALCGYDGPATLASTVILCEAGFGSLPDLFAELSCNQHCEFERIAPA